MSISNHSPSSSLSPLLSDEGEKVELLAAVNDDYEGVIVEMRDPLDSGAFLASLKASISQWRQQEGFWYHHAEPSYLMLVHWLPAIKHTLPVNATHRVGIGAFVMTDKREVLAVQEKTGRFRGSGVWKIPTGVIEQGEDIVTGAIREVKEETGIDAEFVEILAFRQSHKAFFEKSDLFFVCMLRPLSFEIQIQESEIEAAQWMSIEEYAAQPFAQSNELSKCVIDLGLASFEQKYAGFLPVNMSKPRGVVYLNSRDLSLA